VNYTGGQRDGGSSLPTEYTLRALDGPSASTAKVLGIHTLFLQQHKPQNYKLQLVVDVPSVASGTGAALLLDGQDTALVRASVMEKAEGASAGSGSTGGYALVASSATVYRISWRIVSGPGRMNGVGNGNTSSHEPLKSTAVNAYLGMARGIFTVTLDCVTPNRELALSIDVDSAKAGTGARVGAPGSTECVTPQSIVVEASATGDDGTTLAPVNITIAVSANAATDSPMAVAASTAVAPGSFDYLKSFVG
jgi:hypothetical protein